MLEEGEYSAICKSEECVFYILFSALGLIVSSSW